MNTQTVLRNIDAQIKKGRSPLVVLSLAQWEKIEDLIYELSSPQLLKSIKETRNDYRKAILYKNIRRELIK